MATKSALELLAEREGTTALELALDNYQLWYNANAALSLNKEYEIANGQNSKRKLTRADSDEVLDQLNYWENELGKLQGIDPSAPKLSTIFTAGIPYAE